MARNKCSLCGSARSVMRTLPEGGGVCLGAAEKQCAEKRALQSRARARIEARRDSLNRDAAAARGGVSR